MKWAKEEARMETLKYKKEQQAKAVQITFHSDQKLDYDHQAFYRGGYLFPQAFYTFSGRRISQNSTPLPQSSLLYYQNTRTAETGVYICRMLNAIDEAGFELQLTNEALEYYSHNPGIPSGPYVLVNKTGPAE